MLTACSDQLVCAGGLLGSKAVPIRARSSSVNSDSAPVVAEVLASAPGDCDGGLLGEVRVHRRQHLPARFRLAQLPLPRERRPLDLTDLLQRPRRLPRLAGQVPQRRGRFSRLGADVHQLLAGRRHPLQRTSGFAGGELRQLAGDPRLEDRLLQQPARRLETHERRRVACRDAPRASLTEAARASIDPALSPIERSLEPSRSGATRSQSSFLTPTRARPASAVAAPGSERTTGAVIGLRASRRSWRSRSASRRARAKEVGARRGSTAVRGPGATSGAEGAEGGTSVAGDSIRGAATGASRTISRPKSRGARSRWSSGAGRAGRESAGAGDSAAAPGSFGPASCARRRASSAHRAALSRSIGFTDAPFRGETRCWLSPSTAPSVSPTPGE